MIKKIVSNKKQQNMSNCIVPSITNREESKLFNKLLEILKDEDAAIESHSYFRTKEFIDIFGDYTSNQFEDTSDLGRVDENGEPKLHFNEVLHKHYFITKDNEKMYYPHTRTGLERHFFNNEILALSKTMALAYYSNNFEFNTSTFDFDRRNNHKLEEFVKRFIELKSDELINNDDPLLMSRGLSLQDTLDNLSEWVMNVKNIYKQYSINLSEEDIFIENEEESTRGELIRSESFLKDPKLNVSQNIKLFLSLFRSDKLNEFNEFEFVNFNEIYGILNDNLSNIVTFGEEDIFDQYLEKIKELAKVKPYLNQLYEHLKRAPEEFENKFVEAFDLAKNNFLVTEISKQYKDKHKGITHSVLNASETGSVQNEIINRWNYLFTEKEFSNDDLGKINKQINSLYTQTLQKFNSIQTEQNLIPYLNKVKDIFSEFGIELSDNHKEILYYLNDFSEDKPINEKVTKLIKFLQDFETGIQRYIDEKTEDIFRDQSQLKSFAKSVGFFSSKLSNSSVFAGNESRWNYSKRSYLDTKLLVWKKDPTELLKHYNSNPYYQGDPRIEYLLAFDVEEGSRLEESKKRLNEIDTGIFTSLQEEHQAADSVKTKEISDTDALVDFINKVLAFKKVGGKVYSKTAIAADKSTERQVSYPNNELFNFISNAVVKDNFVFVDDAILESFYNDFVAEYNTYKYEKDYLNRYKNSKEKLLPNYHTGVGNAFRSTLFPSLTHYFEKGYVSLDVVKDQIKEDIANILNQRINSDENSVYKELFEEQIFTWDSRGNIINNGVDVEIFNKYLKESGNIESRAIMKLAADIFINGVKSQLLYAKLFTGNPAYYKNMIDYRKRVPGSYTDGSYVRVLPGEEFSNVAVIDSVEIQSKYYNELKELVGKKIADKYKNINNADAQAWISPERWKFLNKSKWSKTYESVYNKMQSTENPKFTEKELKILGQPLKGVYYDIVEGRPVFLKYSQAVLWNSLVKGNPELELFSKKMKEADVSELVTKDAIKVGYFTPVTTHDKFGNLKSEEDFTFKGNTFQINNFFWKLQQDLPTKGMKRTELGSQIQKIIFQALVYNQDEVFNLQGEEKSGKDLIKLLNNLLSDLSNKGTDKVFKQLGIDPATHKITNEDRLYEAILHQVKSRKGSSKNIISALEAGTSPYGIPGFNEIFQNMFSSIYNKAAIKIKTNGGGFIQMSDYGLGKKDVENSSIVYTPWMTTDNLPPPKFTVDPKTGKKTVTPGGVFISGSIIAKYIPDWKNFSPEKLFGKLNPENGKYEGGMIDEEILRNMITYRIPNQGLPSNDAMEILGIIPEAVGDTVIPYTGITVKTGSDFDIDKMYFMLPNFRTVHNNGVQLLKESGLTEELASKIIMNELGYTSSNPIQEFYDYYSELREFEYPLDIPSQYIFSKIEERLENEPITNLKYIKPNVEISPDKQSIGAVENLLIETFKSILTHEKVVPLLMTPLDVDYISNDLINLNPDITRADMLDYDVLSDIKLKGRFNTGKVGLGQNINFLIDAVRGSMSNMLIKDGGIIIGRGNLQNNDLVLDRENSETLNKDEIKAYVESYNSKEKNPLKHITEKDVMKKVPLFEGMMAYVNGFVDIAKDDYITRGNWNTLTNDVGFYLIRAGVHPFYVNAFMSNPIVKDFIKFSKVKTSKIVDDSYDLFNMFKIDYLVKMFSNNTISVNNKTYQEDRIIKPLFSNYNINKLSSIKEKEDRLETLEKYTNNLIKQLYEIKEVGKEFDGLKSKILDNYEKVFLNQDLYRSLGNISLKQLRDEQGDLKMDLSILELYNEIKENLTGPLNESTNSAKTDVNGKGKNITSTIVANNRMLDFSLGRNNDKYPYPLINTESKLKFDEDTDTFLKTFHNNAVTKAMEIMKNNPKFFLTASDIAESTFNLISQLVYDKNLTSQELGDTLERNYYSYIMSGFKPLQMEENEKKDLLNQLPHTFVEMYSNYPDNKLLDTLRIKVGNENDYYIALPNFKFDSEEKNALTDAWRDLFDIDPKFAEDLIKYSYLISGFNNTLNQFHEYIPYEWFNRNGFNTYLNSLKNKTAEYDTNFINQLLRNNADNSSLTSKIKNFDFNYVKIGKGFSEGFLYTGAKKMKPLIVLETTDDFNPGGGTSRSYYIFKGYVKGNALYTRTTLLGKRDSKGNKIVEYDINNNKFVSELKHNKLTSKIDNGIIREYINSVDDFKLNTYNTLPNKGVSLEEQVLKTEETSNQLNLFTEEDLEDAGNPCKNI